MKLLKRILRKIAENLESVQDSAPLILNEAVNFEKQCIFIAIPKTGTTAVRSQLRQQGTPLITNAHLDIMQVKDSLYIYLLIEALGKNRSFPTDKIPTDDELRSKATSIFGTFFKFSAVRNPWARAVSLYFRGEGVQVKDIMSFQDFCKNHFYASDTCHHPTLHKNQLDWLCDENGRLLMDYVYRLEDFGDAVKEIQAHTNGRLKLANTSANVNRSSLSRKYRELYTDETKKIIASRFEKDIDYFEYTF